MNTYTDLEDVVLAYLQDNVTVAEVFKGTTDPATLTAKIKELILRASNNAKQTAQQMHNFVYDEVSAMAVIPAGSGLDLTSLVDAETAEVFGLNILTEALYNDWPIAMSSRGAYNKLLYKQGQVNRVTGVRQRNRLKLIPAQSVDVDVEVLGYRKLIPYGDNATFKVTTALAHASGFYSSISTGEVYVDGVAGTYAIGDQIVLSGATPAAYLGRFTVNNVIGSILYLDVTATTDNSNVGFTIQNVDVDGEFLFNEAVTTDWLLDEGFEYLQWATICEVNHLVQIYLNRAEGTLPPPTKSRDAALEKLIRWDVDLLESNYTTNIL